MSANVDFLKQKGAAFWVFHLIWSFCPLAICFLISDLNISTWLTLSVVLAITGFFYHRRSSESVTAAGIENIGDINMLMAEVRASERMVSILSTDPTEVRNNIQEIRRDTLRRFADAAPHIRFAWFIHSVCPGFVVFGGLALWLWWTALSTSASVPVAVVTSFILMTAQFINKSAYFMLADVFSTT